MATVVSLRVSGISFDEEQRIDKIEAQIPSISFIKSNGFTVAEVCVDDGTANVFNTVTEVIHLLELIDSGVKVQRVDPALVNTSDIARLAGVSRQAVAKWVQREGSTFPRELDSVGDASQARKIWSLYEVNEWLLSELHLDLDLDLPSQEVVNAINSLFFSPKTAFRSKTKVWTAQKPRRKFVMSYTRNEEPHLRVPRFASTSVASSGLGVQR